MSTGMGDTPIYSGIQQGPQQPQTPEAVNPVDPNNLASQVDELVRKRLTEVESKYQDRIKALEDALKAAGPPATAFTEHAAGPGYKASPTWSQALQEAARDGRLTHDMLAAAGMTEEAISDVLKVA
jgi:hypothetical protein